MEALMEVAKVYNVLEAKLKHSKVPLPVNIIAQCPDLANSKHHQVRDCLRSMVNRGLVSRVPIFEGRDRVGYVWGKVEAPTVPATVKPTVAKVTQEEVRLRINPDKSITILTAKFKVTIEVPE